MSQAVRCPKCGCFSPDNAILQFGQCYTGNGVAIVGRIDDRTAEACAAATQQLFVYFPLRTNRYRIVKCLQCREEMIVVNDIPPAVVHPISANDDPAVPKELPENIRRALFEAKKAHAIRLETASLLAARTALIRMQRHQECKGIDELASKGVITRFLAAQAHEIRLWANVAGHDDVPSDVPAPEDVEQLIGFLDVLLDTIYVQPARLEALRQKRTGQATSSK
jgi:predicted nucleic-acid-binding Zn-ribbon protein